MQSHQPTNVKINVILNLTNLPLPQFWFTWEKSESSPISHFYLNNVALNSLKNIDNKIQLTDASMMIPQFISDTLCPLMTSDSQSQFRILCFVNEGEKIYEKRILHLEAMTLHFQILNRHHFIFAVIQKLHYDNQILTNSIKSFVQNL